MVKCLAIANFWCSDYKIMLFNSLSSKLEDFKVLYVAETSKMREWKCERDSLLFPYEIMFDGSINDTKPLSVIAKTWKRLNVLNPDVLILGGYDYIACWTGFFWGRMHGKKLILWSASNEEDRGRIFYKERIKEYFVKRCDAANVYGTRNRDYLVKLGMDEKRIFIKGNTTNNEFYYDETAKIKINKSSLCKQLGLPQKNFLYIGRFSPEKNILNLLKAYKKLSDECKNAWGLILVGDGPQKAEIELFIRKNALQNVFLPGFKQKAEMPKFMAISDVFILPSISEPWGLVVNEAMASGLPVLVSNKCGCYPDIVKDGLNGFSFDPYDIDILFKYMRDFVEGKYNLESMGKESLRLIKNYTPQNAADVIVKSIAYVIAKT